jgi:hypothetical protein
MSPLFDNLLDNGDDWSRTGGPDVPLPSFLRDAPGAFLSGRRTDDLGRWAGQFRARGGGICVRPAGGTRARVRLAPRRPWLQLRPRAGEALLLRRGLGPAVRPVAAARAAGRRRAVQPAPIRPAASHARQCPSRRPSRHRRRVRVRRDPHGGSRLRRSGLSGRAVVLLGRSVSRPISTRDALRTHAALGGPIVQVVCWWMREHPTDPRALDIATELAFAVGELSREACR